MFAPCAVVVMIHFPPRASDIGSIILDSIQPGAVAAAAVTCERARSDLSRRPAPAQAILSRASANLRIDRRPVRVQTDGTTREYVMNIRERLRHSGDVMLVTVVAFGSLLMLVATIMIKLLRS